MLTGCWQPTRLAIATAPPVHQPGTGQRAKCTGTAALEAWPCSSHEHARPLSLDRR